LKHGSTERPATGAASANGGSSIMSAADLASIQILVVSEAHSVAQTCANVLRLDGYEVLVCDRGEEALDLVSRRAFDIVLADLEMPKVSGMRLLAHALATHPNTIVIVMTEDPSVESSIETVKAGAWDYLAKPMSAAQLRVVVGRAAHRVLITRERVGVPRITGEGRSATTILGVSPGIRQAVELALRVAPTDASVFISGESGSGKELVAQFIHENSSRSTRPFVAVNCAALPDTLLESEMFGHRRGAFTGAVRDKPGLLEAADGGTMFLDELVDMPKPAQAKLLRVIQDGVVRRVGSETTDAVVNVRFISAANSDLEAARRRGFLREDLYYRLHVVPIHLPPLRERPEDVPMLAEHFLEMFWLRRGQAAARRPELAPSAMAALASYGWPGNVRELQNVIEHVTVLAEPGAQIAADELPFAGRGQMPVENGSGVQIAVEFSERYHAARERVLTQFEMQYLTWLVEKAGGNLSEAARIAGVDRTTLYRVMERHGWERPTPASGWTPVRSQSAVPADASESPIHD
jgi:DNA-binding NtrC family response regulator